MANSKGYISFRNKMSHFDADLEYVDILFNTVKDNPINSDATELFPGSRKDKYKILSGYKIVQANRLLVVRHLRSTLYTAYIKDLYEEFTIYLKGILKEAYDNAKITPERLTGEHKISMSSVDILKHVKQGNLTDVVIDTVFQSMENDKSTISLITKVHRKIGIELDQSLINDAIYYLEIRHKLVHTDGLADEEFRNSHPSLTYTNDNYIALNYTTVAAAKNAVFKLVADIDQKIMEKELVKPHTTPKSGMR